MDKETPYGSGVNKETPCVSGGDEHIFLSELGVDVEEPLVGREFHEKVLIELGDDVVLIVASRRDLQSLFHFQLKTVPPSGEPVVDRRIPYGSVVVDEYDPN